MKMIMAWLLAAVVLVAASVALCAENQLATVDMGRLMKAHPDSAEAEAHMKKQVEEFEAEQQELMAGLEKARGDAIAARSEAASTVLSNKGRAEKEKVLEQMIAALREQELAARDTLRMRQKQLVDQEVRMRRRIVNKIREVVSEHAKAKGYLIVVDSSAVGMGGIDTVVYSSETIDITPGILAIIKPPAVEQEE